MQTTFEVLLKNISFVDRLDRSHWRDQWRQESQVQFSSRETFTTCHQQKVAHFSRATMSQTSSRGAGELIYDRKRRLKCKIFEVEWEWSEKSSLLLLLMVWENEIWSGSQNTRCWPTTNNQLTGISTAWSQKRYMNYARMIGMCLDICGKMFLKTLFRSIAFTALSDKK